MSSTDSNDLVKTRLPITGSNGLQAFSNDLDVETLRALEDALLEFGGSVLVIIS